MLTFAPVHSSPWKKTLRIPFPSPNVRRRVCSSPGKAKCQAGRCCWYRMQWRGLFPNVRILMMMLSQRLGMHWFKHQLLFVCVHVFVVCRRVAGELSSVIFSLGSYPSFIFQTFLVLNQPCSATAREAVSLSC